ncbi:RidA family protein [Achromobacter ruhlandii]|uniref:RidA family protein n=1 Tax=Achromobacter ruhlandii TaxID=72557 RepID=UPI003B9CC1EA
MRQAIQRLPSSLPFPFSRAVKAGGFLFLSGQVPMSAAGEVVRGDIQTQTRAACERIVESLAAGGARLDQVVKATVWLSDMSHFAGFNEVYKEFFGAALPVRSTVASALALNVDVEIEVQAYIGHDPSGQD